VKIRKIYTGKLTYAANWDDFDKVPFGRNLITLESMLIFRYLMPHPKVEELNKAWKQHITKWTNYKQDK
jgi:hypothetical protein